MRFEFGLSLGSELGFHMTGLSLKLSLVFIGLTWAIWSQRPGPLNHFRRNGAPRAFEQTEWHPQQWLQLPGLPPVAIT